MELFEQNLKEINKRIEQTRVFQEDVVDSVVDFLVDTIKADENPFRFSHKYDVQVLADCLFKDELALSDKIINRVWNHILVEVWQE